MSFIERRKLVRILADHVQRKDCIHTNSRVTSIKEFDDYVEVGTNKGHLITADLLLGSDGVNSAVRKFVDSSRVGDVPFADDGALNIFLLPHPVHTNRILQTLDVPSVLSTACPRPRKA